jgi:hypothetical protein
MNAVMTTKPNNYIQFRSFCSRHDLPVGGHLLTRSDAVQLKMVTSRIDAVKTRECGEKCGEKQPHRGGWERRYVTGGRCGSAHHITPGLSNVSIRGELPVVSMNALIYSFICLSETPDTKQAAALHNVFIHVYQQTLVCVSSSLA